MRSVLVFMVLLAAQTTSMGDAAFHSKVPMVAAQSAQHADASSAASLSVAKTRQILTSQMLERTLMVLLAMAAVGFQVRRKYKASQRMWQQRIIDQTEFRLQPRVPRRAIFGAGSTAQWQQSH